jgi:hypothetical protein
MMPSVINNKNKKKRGIKVVWMQTARNSLAKSDKRSNVV